LGTASFVQFYTRKKHIASVLIIEPYSLSSNVMSEDDGIVSAMHPVIGKRILFSD
jgi:hypothetical protein